MLKLVEDAGGNIKVKKGKEMHFTQMAAIILAYKEIEMEVR